MPYHDKIDGSFTDKDGHRLLDNIRDMRDHMLSLNDNSLKALKIKPQHMARFAHASIVAFSRQDMPLIGITPFCGSKLFNRIEFSYNPQRINAFDDKEQKKLIGHEFGHFFQAQRGYLPSVMTNATMVGSLFSGTGPLKKAAQMALGAGIGWLAHTGLITPDDQIPTVLSCGLGAMAAIPLINYADHLCEYDADAFADTLMPQLSLRSITEKISAMENNTHDMVYTDGLDKTIKRAQTLMTDHPLRIERVERSEKRCARLMHQPMRHSFG